MGPVSGGYQLVAVMEHEEEEGEAHVAAWWLWWWQMEVAFPPEVEPPIRFFGLKWWRSVAIKALVLYFNYLQSAQSARAMRRAAQRRQEKYPPFPLF